MGLLTHLFIYEILFDEELQAWFLLQVTHMEMLILKSYSLKGEKSFSWRLFNNMW